MPSKPGKPANASESEIAALITHGKSNSDIARALHVDRKRVAKVRAYANSLKTIDAGITSVDTIKAVVRLELNQEEARSEFSDQLAEATKNYRAAMNRCDEDTAVKWAILRNKMLENMVKISGLDQRKDSQTLSPQEMLSQMSDEEVERRARAILAKRQ
ncbi:MAG TPA: hypothetical protein VLH13_00045 [Methanomassiliicoccales archaeon]|nr:hypothetical protein [Methanomassiliicoccales archaeon]